MTEVIEPTKAAWTATPARDRIVRQLAAHRAEWRALVVEVGLDRMDEPGPMGDWTFRDLAVHLLGWRDWTIARIEAAADGAPAPHHAWPDGLDNDGVNQWIQDQGLGRSKDDVLEAIDISHERLAAALCRFPESTLTDPAAMPDLEGQAAVDIDWVSHFHDEHQPDVRAWLARRD